MLSAFRHSRLGRVFGIADFRLYWIGAFFSFTGSWVQNVAQGFYVFQLTGDEAKLATVSLAASLPVALFGIFLGGYVDRLDKRRTLVVCQTLFGLVALSLAWAAWRGVASYGTLLFAATLNGFISCFEVSTRQSVISRVVPRDLLAAAVPVSAMTFNLGRIVGPAIGGLLLATIGVPACYLVNGLSFVALIWGVLAIRADLSADPTAKASGKAPFLDGLRFTWNERRLRALLFLETITACFGVFYVTLVPSYVERTLGLSGADAKAGNGHAYSAIGVGALAGLVFATTLTEDRVRIRLVQVAMLGLATGLVALSFLRVEWATWPLFALTGACAVIQFNTTNGLFQTISPENLRGRVLSLHVWALNGLSPFGGLLLGWVASMNVRAVGGGVPIAMRIGAAILFAAALIGWFLLPKKVLSGECATTPSKIA